MVCVFVDEESSRLRAIDRPRSDWLCVSEVCIAGSAAARLHGYKACSLPMYTKAMKDLLRMLARASVAQTLRGTRCGGGACMQSSKKCLAASVSDGMVSRMDLTRQYFWKTGQTDRRKIRRLRVAGGLEDTAKQQQRDC